MDATTLDLTISMPGFTSSGEKEEARRVRVMRDLDINQVPSGDEEYEDQWIDDDETSNGSAPRRKKLRLSKEQSRLLEENFRQNHTLNTKQKEALAMQLKLRPRQVEVWFQNRRARSKLKQTEMECVYLKRWFGSLTEQNRRLQREVEELRAMKVGVWSCQPSPAASSLSMCPSCERITTASVLSSAKPPV